MQSAALWFFESLWKSSFCICFLDRCLQWELHACCWNLFMAFLKIYVTLLHWLPIKCYKMLVILDSEGYVLLLFLVLEVQLWFLEIHLMSTKCCCFFFEKNRSETKCLVLKWRGELIQCHVSYKACSPFIFNSKMKIWFSEILEICWYVCFCWDNNI